MNVYLIQEEDDFNKYFQARCMQDAITVATQEYCKEEYDDTWDPEDRNGEEETPDLYYQRVILQSCSLIGELANP